MRLFIAVMPDEKVSKALINAMHDLKKAGVGGNYPSAKNLHMTLAFIGELPDALPVKEAMKKVEFERFKLSTDGSGSFGNTLWAGVKGNQKMKMNVKALRNQLKEDKVPFENDTFTPHITLVRKASNVIRFPVDKAEMEVRKISLMRSDTKDGKVSYREIFSVECK